MKVYLGIPFYGGASAGFVSSLLKLHVALHLAGYVVECDMHSNCCSLPKTRNEIVKRFMLSGFDKLVFLDNDMTFSLLDIFKLIKSEHDICGIDYRKRKEELEFCAVLTGRENGEWAQATAAGTGLMCITRSTIEQMQQYYPETRYVNETGEICFALFDNCIFEGRYIIEDYTFCRRWVEMGNDISILKDAETGHIGTKEYKANRQEIKG